MSITRLALIALLLIVPISQGWATVSDGVAALERSDYEAAAAEFKPLAESGNAEAQAYLGFLYQTGRGVPRDANEAARWTRMAGEQGHLDAQYNLGQLYRVGRGVPQDDAKALTWLRRAAEGGQPDAQLELGQIYESEVDDLSSRDEALRWYRAAAANGNAEAREALGRLGETPPTVVAAAECKEIQITTSLGEGDAGGRTAMACRQPDGQWKIVPRDAVAGPGPGTEKAVLGVEIQAVTPEMQADGVASGSGALILAVTPGSAAERAKLRRGDVIREIDGRRIAGAQDVVDTVTALRPGQEVMVQLERDRAVFFRKVTMGGVGASARSASTTPRAPIPYSDDVARAQKALAGLGYDPGPADGRMGPRTAKAIRRYQRDQGQTATGEVGPALVAELEAAAAASPAADGGDAPEPAAASKNIGDLEALPELPELPELNGLPKLPELEPLED
ncbi:MAG: PDZ domain-containing protein [Rhodospirillaceae bacterium]|nr:PDZ domain-containing protein [Rhodospirillaceae bacterium]